MPTHAFSTSTLTKLGAGCLVRTDDLSLTRRLHYHCANPAYTTESFLRFQLQVECFLVAEPILKTGTVNGNRTRLNLIDSQVHSPECDHGINLAVR